MAQAADYEVGNGTGAAVRSAINSRFNALFTNHSGASDTNIGTKYPYMFWAHNDPAVNQLKIRNPGNSDWIPLRNLADGGVEGGNTLAFRSNGTERIKIDSSIADDQGGPSVFFKTGVNPFNTNAEANEGAQITQRGRLNIGIYRGHGLGLNRLDTTGPYAVFAYNGTQLSGSSISTNGTTVSFNAGSDYRLKENVVSLSGSDAKTRVKQLKVNRFNFIKDPSLTVDGFIAHEAQTVVPEAVTGYKDEVDASGNPVYQGIDQAKFVPLLTAALQEAYSEIEALTARVAALEAA
jgi:hypothetical protein